MKMAEALSIHYLKTVDEKGEEILLDPRVILLKVYARIAHLNVSFKDSSQPAHSTGILPSALLDGLSESVGAQGILESMRARLRKIKASSGYHGSVELLDENNNDLFEYGNAASWIEQDIGDAIEYCLWANSKCYKDFTVPILRRSIPFPINAVYLRTRRDEVVKKYETSTTLGKEQRKSAGRRMAKKLEAILLALQSYIEIEFPLFAREDFPNGDSAARPPSFMDTVLYAYLRALHNIPEKYLAEWTEEGENNEDKLLVVELFRGHKKFIDAFERYLEECSGSKLETTDTTLIDFTADMTIDGSSLQPAVPSSSRIAAESAARAEHENAIREKKPADVLFVGAALSVTVVAVLASALRRMSHVSGKV